MKIITMFEVQPDKKIFILDGVSEELKHENIVSARRIFISNQEQAKQLIEQSYGHNLDEMIIHTAGYVYPIPGLEWDIVEISSVDGSESEKVAVLKITK